MSEILSVTDAEAREILSRFVASHFDKPDREHARFSIPAREDRDDDLRLSRYITETERLRSALVAAERERDEARAEQNASKRRLAAMVDLAEKRGAAYDIANERIADLQRAVRTVFALIADWRDGNSRLARPMSIADQRFLNGLAEADARWRRLAGGGAK